MSTPALKAKEPDFDAVIPLVPIEREPIDVLREARQVMRYLAEVHRNNPKLQKKIIAALGETATVINSLALQTAPALKGEQS